MLDGHQSTHTDFGEGMTSMTPRRWRPFLASCLLTAALVPAVVAAQTTPAPTTAPAQTTTPRPSAPTEPAQTTASRARSLQREIESSRWGRRPVFRLGQDYTLRSDDTARHVVVVSGNIRVEGRVVEDVVVVFGDVHLASTAVVEGSVVAVAGNVTVNSGAAVDQDLVVVGGSVDAPSGFAPRHEHIVIGLPEMGERLRSVVPWFTRGLLWGRVIVPGLDWVWWVLLVVFSVSLVLNFLFDRAVRSCATVITERPLSALLAGLLTLVLLAPIFVILAATVVGILIIPFFACAVVVAWMLGKIGVVRSIGGAVVRQDDPSDRGQGMRSFLIGFGIMTLAYMVPALGIIAWAMIGVFGLGAGTMTFLAALRRESPRKVPPPAAGPSTPEPSPPPPMRPAAGVYAPGAPASMASAVEPSAPYAYQTPESTVHAPPIADAPSAYPPAASPAAAAVDRRAYATFLDRVAAFALDCLLVAIAINLLELNRDGGPFFVLLLVYHVAFWTWRGTTMGGIVVGLRVVRANGDNLRPIEALVRGLGAIFSVGALGIGCFWMLQDPERQMWHDKIAGTHVMRVPRNALLEGDDVKNVKA
jgi:uncharacterized RDD family membrane protein YckC